MLATVVLSFGSALGLSSLAFKYLFGFGGADTSFPLFVFAFLVALGVLLDTFVVRSVLVTAINLDLGRWMWWPSRLSREPVAEFPQVADQPMGAR